jgi:hypothetical protein
MGKPYLLITIIMFFSVNAYCNDLVVRYFQTDQRYSYRIELLKLALDKTVDTDGPYALEPETQEMTQSRGLAFLAHRGTINVAFLPTNVEREKTFLPIRIPILRGILGYRVFIIHKDNSRLFSNAETFKDLKKHCSAGFGAQWADLVILAENGIKVVKTAKYESLFVMLENKRFHYFPRGINEAWNEIETFSSKYPDLVVEPHLAFYYPYPVYFFVNKNDTFLAVRIEKGLSLALADGSFKALFFKYHKDLINRANLSDRKLFRLKNPTLPPGTPEPDTSWWLDGR